MVETGVKAHRATQRSSSPGKTSLHHRAAALRSRHVRACLVSMFVIRYSVTLCKNVLWVEVSAPAPDPLITSCLALPLLTDASCLSCACRHADGTVKFWDASASESLFWLFLSLIVLDVF